MTEAEKGALKPPQQTRSRKTLERIVRASLDILREEGPGALTVQSIVARAGSSVGSFYARFDGKEDLLEYLGDRVWREALDRWHEAMASRDWSDLDLPHLIEGAVGLLVDAQRSRSSYLRSLDRAAGRNDEAYVRFRHTLADGIAEMLLARRSQIDHPDPELAVRVGLMGALGVVDAETGDAPELPREVVVREATALLLGYLVPGRGAADGAGDVDFFDIWG